MADEYVEITIPASLEPGELLDRLQGSEALGAWEDEGVLRLYWRADRWNSLSLENLRETLLVLGCSEAADHIGIRYLPDQDWNTRWTKSLTPIRIGRRLRIRQSWNPRDPDFGGTELVIDPKRAFGTGYHATTQLVIEWLEDHIRGGERLLDIGTGTGVLAMTALRFGAASALAADNDPVAVECAGENAAANGFGPELELRVASFEMLDMADFDVIVANLDLKTILLLCRRLPRRVRPGARICLSGLLIENLQEVREAVSGFGGNIIGTREREEWIALEAVF
ncbi:MAG TPA: 50S ribosomal protein L11 methyltransferase [Acidobacteriota bacterium]|nr:50S ribosomal protein L11 methyltransferase [Acidobacteriota bacterium]